MKLSVFIQYQSESDKPFMCIDQEHLMPLVPFMTDELVIELRCFVLGCDYKITPGLLRYEEIINQQKKVLN